MYEKCRNLLNQVKKSLGFLRSSEMPMVPVTNINREGKSRSHCYLLLLQCGIKNFTRKDARRLHSKLNNVNCLKYCHLWKKRNQWHLSLQNKENIIAIYMHRSRTEENCICFGKKNLKISLYRNTNVLYHLEEGCIFSKPLLLCSPENMTDICIKFLQTIS